MRIAPSIFPEERQETYTFTFSIGADPEVFLLNNRRQVVEPISTLRKRSAGLLAPDGAQLEMHPTPSYCRGGFVGTLRTAMCYARHVAEENSANLAILPVVSVSPKVRGGFSEKANVFGCDPDWSAYTLACTKLKCMNAATHPWRYGGGHIHIGCEKHMHAYLPAFAMMADITAGLLSVVLTPPEIVKLSRKRRRLFGQAGCFRPQPHGWEYRVLDNFWLLHPKLVYLFVGLVRDATRIVLQKPKEAQTIVENYGETVQDILNEVDVEAASRLFDEVAPLLVQLKDKSTRLDTDFPDATSELGMLPDIPQLYYDHVLPEQKAGPLEKLWRMDSPPVVSFAQQAYAGGGFCRGGFEEFANPELSKMYDWCLEDPRRFHGDYNRDQYR